METRKLTGTPAAIRRALADNVRFSRMSIHDAIGACRSIHLSVVGEDAQGTWRKVNACRTDGFILYLYSPELGRWFIPQRWEIRR